MTRGQIKNALPMQRGFSLTEALVAIAILSFAAISVLSLLSAQTRNLSFMQDRAKARIVSDNLIIADITGEARLPDSETLTGKVTFANTDFTWRRMRALTNIDGIVQITYEVQKADNEQVLATVTQLRRER